MIQATSVISLESRKTRRSLSEAINLVLEELGTRSNNTLKSYRSNYKEFFNFCVGVGIDKVTWEQIYTITYDKVLTYRKYLATKENSPNSNKTINIKVASLNTLYKELHKMDRRVDILVVDLKKLPEDEDQSIQYGSLTEDEMKALLNFTYNLPSNQKPLIKALFFETAYVTALRKGALLNLKWKHIIQEKDKDGTSIWVIRIKHKGKVNDAPITDEMYNKLVQLKSIVHSNGLRNQPEDRVFNVTKKVLANTLIKFCEEYGIDRKGRNIVIHSIKKASIDKVYRETGDINETARHGHHSNISQVYNTYEGQNRNYQNRASMTAFNKEKDLSKLEKLSHKELLEAIRRCGQHTINKIVENIK